VRSLAASGKGCARLDRGLQRLQEEEPQSRSPDPDGQGGELAVAEEGGPVLSNVVRAEVIRRPAAVPGEVFYRMDVVVDRVRRVVMALEFIQHDLAKSGHVDLLVPPNANPPLHLSESTDIASTAQRLT
jgi:hypothetical protein